MPKKKQQVATSCPILVQHKVTGERFFVYAALSDGLGTPWRYLCVREIEANGYAPIVISVSAHDVDDMSLQPSGENSATPT